MNVRLLLITRLLLSAIALLHVRPAAADLSAEETKPINPHTLFAKGNQKLSLQTGYGEGFAAFSSGGKDAADVRTAAIYASWGTSISELQGRDSWYRGAWEFMIEGQLTLQAEPEIGHAGGGTLNFRYNFLSYQRFVPFVGFGAGLAGTDFDLDSASDGFNFVLQGGLGTHWFLSDRTALTAEARWNHFSNAYTRSPNAGVNTALFLFGMTLFSD